MTSATHPFCFLLTALAGWLNRHQQDIIDYLIEENRILKEQLDGGRRHLTDAERRRVAVKAKVLSRQVLEEIETLVAPACDPGACDSFPFAIWRCQK